MNDIATTEMQEAQQHSSAVVAQAEAIQIANDTDFQAAGTFLKEVKAADKKAIALFKEPKQKAHEAHKAIKALEDTVRNPLKSAEGTVKHKIAAYHAKEEAKRREEQAKLEAEAKKAAEEAQLREAEALEAAGDTEAAEAVLNEEPAPIVTAPAVAAPKAEGVNVRYQYKGEVVDLKALIVAIYKGDAPLSLIKADDSAINKMASALKDEMKIPGIRIIKNSIVSGRV